MSHLFQLGETRVSPFSIPGSNTVVVLVEIVSRIRHKLCFVIFSDVRLSFRILMVCHR